MFVMSTVHILSIVNSPSLFKDRLQKLSVDKTLKECDVTINVVTATDKM